VLYSAPVSAPRCAKCVDEAGGSARALFPTGRVRDQSAAPVDLNRAENGKIRFSITKNFKLAAAISSMNQKIQKEPARHSPSSPFVSFGPKLWGRTENPGGS